MSAAGPVLWRTIGLGFVSPSLRKKAVLELAHLQRWSQLKRLWTQQPQCSSNALTSQLRRTSFSTVAKWHAQVGVSRSKKPLTSQDSRSLRDLSPPEIASIFGDSTPVENGNKILQKLQSQRVSGTLDEGIPEEPEIVTAEALAWLRRYVPWDEDASIVERLDREEEEERSKLVTRAEKLGLYKSTAEADDTPNQPEPRSEDTPSVYIPQQDAAQNKRTSSSFIERLKERNKKRGELEAEAKEKALEEAKAEGIRTGLPVTWEQRELARKTENARWKEEKVELAQSVFGSKAGEWPDLAPWQRLWPSALTTIGIVGLSLLFAAYYSPPPPKGRIWPEWSMSSTTVGVLITMNALVFLAWRVVPLQRSMFLHFMSVPGYPRVSTLIGNTFSHQGAAHLTVNMIALWIFGTRLHEDIGRGPFLATYVATGALSSMFSLSSHVMKSVFVSGSLGASGVICGIVAAWCVVNKDKTVKIWGVPQSWTEKLPTLGVLALLIAFDVLSFRRGTLAKPYLGTDWVAHLGGYGSGIVAGALLWRQQQRGTMQRRREDEKVALSPMSRAFGKVS